MNILLVEDDSAVASFIIRSLTEEGYSVSLAPDGHLALQMAGSHRFSVILLDVMLPGINGLEVCRQLRASGDHTPVLMLTALGTTENLVTGLDTGADDYLSKPFKMPELLARIRSLTRRSGLMTESSPGAATPAETLQFADLSLDTAQKTASRAGRTIDLTPTEYRLLLYFMQNPRRVLSRMDILAQVWGIDFNMNTKVVDVYVNYLRRKVDKEEHSRLLQTVVGMGYMLKENAP